VDWLACWQGVQETACLLRRRAVSPGEIALYDKLIATNPTIERKAADNPYAAVDGNMFTLFRRKPPGWR
jgi:hypothetical protein